MRTTIAAALFALSLLAALMGCGGSSPAPQPATSAAGVRQATAEVPTDSAGNTAEQANILERLKRDNQPGSIKHLYVISAYSGQVLIYSPVKGKVTSSGKRLTPTTMATMNANQGTSHWERGLPFHVSGSTHYTGEVIQDDGTYGSSEPYLYWFGVNGAFHQHYVSGGQIIHISDRPLDVKGVVITLGTEGAK